MRSELGVCRIRLDSMKSAWTIGNEGIAYSVESSECYGDRQESVHHYSAAAKVYVIAVAQRRRSRRVVVDLQRGGG